ncbi:histidine phosphatase family protein [Streptomyces sp. RS10V-4]|uniref:histidine-type phosphatase n=1 Tax=Streptomyces rhizoryzae TaxID=2932493 RepID=UPI00200621DC|nr:histidine-type phosphatase [Streptomyces rhizoryzae]MCK7626615.1 histidine phosphatase family protein [Streptomyces rhizoryzae]
MRRTVSALALSLSVVLAATTATALPAQAGSARDARTPAGAGAAYSTKTPYEPRQNPRTYEPAPDGFVPVFTEIVSRHGSRSATDSDDGDMILRLWEEARKEGQLTPLGREFGPDVRALLDAVRQTGYGKLSGRGKRELRGTALRMVQRLPQLFTTIVEDGESVDVVSSGQGRAVDSGTVFTDALTEADPALTPHIGRARTDKDLLYFHKSAGGAAYRDWLAHDQRLADTLKKLDDQPATRAAARRVLAKLFRPAFVRRVADGEFAALGTDVSAARAVYNLYSTAPAMSDESPREQGSHAASRRDGGWRLDRYLAQRDADRFGYLNDAEEFYEKGPSFAGSDITYRMAEVLLDDFFQQAEAKRDGTSTLGAELRFTHAEEIIPLAALMGLPGSTEAAAPGTPYTYADNPWRGATVAPMATNIQWDMYRKGGTFLVRMLYNERETPFKAGCRPVARHSHFYDLRELERCFGRTAG